MMKNFVLGFILLCGAAFASAPMTFFGDFNAGRVLSPGIGVALPLTTIDTLPIEISKLPGSVTTTFGVEHSFVVINRDRINGTIAIGGNFGYGSRFVSQYSVGYSKWLSSKWSVVPYVKYETISGSSGWSGGLKLLYRSYR